MLVDVMASHCRVNGRWVGVEAAAHRQILTAYHWDGGSLSTDATASYRQADGRRASPVSRLPFVSYLRPLLRLCWERVWNFKGLLR